MSILCFRRNNLSSSKPEANKRSVILFSTRISIFLAAAVVNVSTNSLSISHLSKATLRAILSDKTSVLPLPAAAATNTSAPVNAIACHCAGVGGYFFFFVKSSIFSILIISYSPLN